MARYKITFRTPEGEKSIYCNDDEYILDAAEKNSNSLFGPGKWVILDIDRFSFKNVGIFIIQRIAHLDTGKVPGDRELWHTERTVTLEWVEEDDYRDGFHTSGEHMYGETRVIMQTYLPLLQRDGSYRMRWEPDLLSELD